MALQRGGSTTIVDTLHMRYHQEDRWSRSANQLKIKSNTADSPCSLQRRCTWLTTDWGCLHTSFHTAMAMVVVAMAMAVAVQAVQARLGPSLSTAGSQSSPQSRTLSSMSWGCFRTSLSIVRRTVEAATTTATVLGTVHSPNSP